ncbi:MAG: S1C family serine protease [Bacteroidota bacterium]
MRRTTLYSSSGRTGRPRAPAPAAAAAAPPPPPPAAAPAEKPGRKLSRRAERVLLVVAGAGVAALLAFALGGNGPPPQRITQQDIDAAVRHTLETKPLPSVASRAAEAVRPSVVRVQGLNTDPDGYGDIEHGVGTGVVIVDKGLILTNLHVVAGSDKVKVTFSDGLESDATVVSLQPENDLAVLKAQQVPDDLAPATLRSTKDLVPGDEVVAVGFPFGIGPSVSSGVVSGLKREFRSPQGKRVLTNLIQFDAAANPGSSGGPLVTADGAVVGIVTAILNPSEQRVFVGIGFAVPIENAASAVGMHPF